MTSLRRRVLKDSHITSRAVNLADTARGSLREGAVAVATEGECVLKITQTPSVTLRGPPSSRRKAYIVHLQVRTYSPPKVVVLIENSRYGNNPYRLFYCPLAPEAKHHAVLFYSDNSDVFLPKIIGRSGLGTHFPEI